MELEIMILNTMKYQKEGETKIKSRLAYIIPTTDAFSNNTKFRGYSELSSYRDDDKYFELIPSNFIGQKCKVKITEKPSKTNPLKSYKEFTEISYNGHNISLV